VTVLATLAASVLVLMLARTNLAGANELTLYSCHDPAGDAVGHDGWRNVRTADDDMFAVDSCAAGGGGYLGLELQANLAGYADSARTEWDFQAPAWSSVASYTLNLAGSYAMPGTGAGMGQAFVNASDEGDPNYDYRNLGAAAQGAWVLARTPPAPVSAITLNTSCDGQTGRCPANTRISALELSAAKIVLRDSTSPTVTGLTGSLLPGASVRGTGEADFVASDPGPGIYSAQLIIDGASQPQVLLDSNGGWCENLGQTTDGTRSFAHPDPCEQTLSGAVSLDSTALADGEHSIRLTVDDASGNTTTAFNGMLTTHNAPDAASQPTLTPSTGLTVGSQLSASAGSWSAPAGTGPITYGFQWQDCNTSGGECESIGAAQSSSYTTTAADAGHTVRVVITASDSDGLSSAASAVSRLIAPPGSSSLAALAGSHGQANGSGASETASLHIDQRAMMTRSYRSSSLTLSGSLTGPQGQPIGSAALDLLESSAGTTRVIGHTISTQAGTFTAHVPGGPSRTVLLGYRAYSADAAYAASAAVRESVLAGVRLSIKPLHASSTGPIRLSGRVLGTLPRTGVIVELLVRYRGAWEPFRTPRTDAHGRFSVRYQFQGAVGRFPFRAEVPQGQAGYPYADGRSSTVTVSSG